jgi:hypothetical protein
MTEQNKYLTLMKLSEQLESEIGKIERGETTVKQARPLLCVALEQLLQLLIEHYHASVSVAEIREWIYEERGLSPFLERVLPNFSAEDIEELQNVLEIIRLAWNIFPHRCLKGKSPLEMVLSEEEQR